VKKKKVQSQCSPTEGKVFLRVNGGARFANMESVFSKKDQNVDKSECLHQGRYNFQKRMLKSITEGRSYTR
jgi:hypothetical protein